MILITTSIFHSQKKKKEMIQLTPLFPSLSKASPHAFVTNGSLTATTKTFPALFMSACFMNPGMWELEQPGPEGFVRFVIWKVWEEG